MLSVIHKKICIHIFSADYKVEWKIISKQILHRKNMLLFYFYKFFFRFRSTYFEKDWMHKNMLLKWVKIIKLIWISDFLFGAIWNRIFQVSITTNNRIPWHWKIYHTLRLDFPLVNLKGGNLIHLTFSRTKNFGIVPTERKKNFPTI